MEKIEKPLHGANVAASVAVVVATFADLTLAGGAATLISGALSVSALVNGAERGQKDIARQIATGLIGPVALSCRSGCSFKRRSFQKPMGFSSLMPSVSGGDYRSR